MAEQKSEKKYCGICTLMGRKELAVTRAKTVYSFHANLCHNCLTIHTDQSTNSED